MQRKNDDMAAGPAPYEAEPGVAEAEGGAPAGLALDFGGRRVALKWHQSRRRGEEPPFAADALRAGLRLGASMEIDLRVTADGGFAVLHDATLDRETSGRGKVAEATSAGLASLAYADASADQPRRLLLAEDLAGLLDGVHCDALLQLDMKDDLALVGARGVDRLASLLAGRDHALIASGDCTELTLAMAARLPALRRGLEPSFRLLDLYRAGRKEALAPQLLAELRGPLRPHMVYLNWRLVLAAREDGIDLVAICHGEGAKVDAWTFNMKDPDSGLDESEWRDFERLLQLGVDQITTDEAIATERAFQARLGRTASSSRKANVGAKPGA